VIENLECRRLRNRIDAFIDNELSTSEREEMLRHAKQCPECGKLLNEYQDMLSLMQKMDEETVIPPEAAQAWRSAVRDEAEHTRRSASRGWTRALGSVAAAFIVLLGVTGLYRSGYNPTMLKGGGETGYYSNVVDNGYYDYDAADRVLGSAESGKLVFESASTAYGCLVEGKAICTGYAAALQLVLQSLGIPCGRVFGNIGDVGHRWNWVKIDGKYCYIDPTGNDVSYDNQDMGIVLYDYFCIGEERLLMSHELLEEEYKYFIPESTSDDFDPLRRNGLYFETYDFETVRAALNSYYQDTNRIDMRFGSEEVCRQALDDMINNGRLWEIECVGYENVQYLVGGSKAYMCMLLY